MLPMPPFIPPSVLWAVDLMTARPGSIHRILWVAIQEWLFFGQQTIENGRVVKLGHKEHHAGYYERVGEYWREGLSMRYDGRNRSVPWSAAFISYVMKTAGVADSDFPRAAAHSRYIHFAIQNRETGATGAKFIGWRVSERAPKEGDLVGYSRAGAHMTYDKAAKRNTYTSHCDIVVYARPGEIGVIGGNVKDSVSLKRLPTDADGFLTDTHNDWFVVIENGLPVR